MTNGNTVVVKQFPKSNDQKHYEAFLADLQSILESDRPFLVFDMSGVRSLDSAGIDLLLHCMEGAMKRNGDLKLAEASPDLASILEMTRVDRLFEIFDDCNDAAESFHRFSGTAARRMAEAHPTVQSSEDRDRDKDRNLANSGHPRQPD